MPSQKRPLVENLDHGDDSANHYQNNGKRSRNDDELEGAEGDEDAEEQRGEGEQEEEEEKREGGGDEEVEEQKPGTELEDDDDGNGEDSEEDSDSSSSGEKPEFVFVELPEIRKDVQCLICLGIIKKTRTVMECLHRFCRECIDKSMRLGNNECPACRTHCASRRSLRDDPNYDKLIAALYPDIDKYEEEELAFHEEDMIRNKEIQASIAQIFQRQSEALVKRRGKDSSGSYIPRPQRNQRNAYLRRRKNSRGTENQGSDDNEDENDDENGGKDSSSSEERSTDVRQKRRKRRSGTGRSHSSLVMNVDGNSAENDVDTTRDTRGISPGLVGNPEVLVWGKGGVRSHTRYGNSSAGSNKSQRNTRSSRMEGFLRNLVESNDEVDFHVKLVSLDIKNESILEQPYLLCQPSLSIKQLREYVALQTTFQAEDVEILLIKRPDDANDSPSKPSPHISEDELQILDGHETLAGLSADRTTSGRYLVLAYRQRQTS